MFTNVCVSYQSNQRRDSPLYSYLSLGGIQGSQGCYATTGVTPDIIVRTLQQGNERRESSGLNYHNFVLGGPSRSQMCES